MSGPCLIEQAILKIATSARAGTSYWDATYRLPLLLLLGNENRGLHQRDLRIADQTVGIPMGGGASSLNVSVAASLVLYELKRIGCL